MKLYTLFRSKAFPLILICSIASILYCLTVPIATGSSSTVIFRVEPNITGGVTVGQNVTVDVYIDAPGGSAIIGWTIDIKVDPEVLEPGLWSPIPPPFGTWIVAKSGQAGYFLYDWKNDTMFFEGERNETAGTITATIETIVAWTGLEPGTGADGTGKLATFYFTSKNETAYSPIEITKAFYYTSWNIPDLDKREPDITIHGHYNEPTYDVAVTSISAPTQAIAGDAVNINVTVANLEAPMGAHARTNLTLTYNTTIIETRLMSLAPETSKTESFTWNTTGLAGGEYVINATATVTGDDDPTNNFNTTTIKIMEHDVAITSVTPSLTLVRVGELVNITVVVENQGAKPEDFNVAVYANETVVATENVTSLLASDSTTLTLEWNTTYVDPGIYTISANATVLESTFNLLGIDDDPDDNTYTYGALTVAKLPFANFTYSPEYPAPNQAITFDASLSTPDGGNITNYAWKFGDGNTTTVYDPVITHAYDAVGTYTVTLNVTDGEGLTDTATAQVTVLLHDIAITNVTPLPTTVKTGEPVSINVTVVNEGTEKETFTVTVYYDETTIGTQTVTELASAGSQSLTFTWDTIGVAVGNYTISAVADSVPGETDTNDNTFTDGDVTVEEEPAVDILPYAAAAGAIAIVIAAVAIYFLKIRKPKPT